MSFLLIFFFTLVRGPSRSLSLNLSDTRVYEPQTRARLGTNAHLCTVFCAVSPARRFWPLLRTSNRLTPTPNQPSPESAVPVEVDFQPSYPEPQPLDTGLRGAYQADIRGRADADIARERHAAGVCVCERESKREREREFVCVCMCV